MELSKSLLQAVFVGLTIGATTSCTSSDLVEDLDEKTPKLEVLTESSGDDGCVITGEGNWEDCPACGLG